MDLTAEEQRVLGCLIEKEATTPEQYPLSMNALVAACNQATNRDPVVTYQEAKIAAALAAMREQKLIRIVYPAHARVTKYRHVLAEAWALAPPELAVVAVLLLRGPQTANELTARTERYADFEDFDGVPGVLARLIGRTEPLVAHLGRRPGQREERYAHLLGARPETEVEAADGAETAEKSPDSSDFRPMSDRILALEADTAILRAELDQLHELVNCILDQRNAARGITN